MARQDDFFSTYRL